MLRQVCFNGSLLFKRCGRKAFYYSKYAFSFPAALIIIAIYPLVRIKLVKLFSDRIGHYAMNTELLLSTLASDQHSKFDKYVFYTCSKSVPICNIQLHLMWKRIIPIISFPVVAFQTDKILERIFKNNYKSKTIKDFELTLGYQNHQNLLTMDNVHLSFNNQEHQLAGKLFEKLGVDTSARFVCLLVRDSDYLQKYLPSSDWNYHDFRNADIATYQKAALYLANKSYTVIRMGKGVKTKFNLRHPLIIDYATHALRSDFLDMYLSAHCHFFISTSSGLDAVPQLFRKPILFTNVAPFQAQLQYWYPCELFITKKVRDKLTNKLIGFKELNDYFNEPSDKVTEVLKRNNLLLMDNTEDEIFDVVKEMEKRLSNSWQETLEELVLQRNFKNLLPLSMISDNKMLSENPNVFYTKLGSCFLKNNRALIDPVRGSMA